MGGKDDPLGTVQKLKVDQPDKWYVHKPEFVWENELHKNLWGFENQTENLIPVRRLDLVLIKKKKRTCHLVDFAFTTNHRVKKKQSEKFDKYLDLARELKKLWNMKMTVIPIVNLKGREKRQAEVEIK